LGADFVWDRNNGHYLFFNANLLPDLED